MQPHMKFKKTFQSEYKFWTNPNEKLMHQFSQTLPIQMLREFRHIQAKEYELLQGKLAWCFWKEVSLENSIRIPSHLSKVSSDQEILVAQHLLIPIWTLLISQKWLHCDILLPQYILCALFPTALLFLGRTMIQSCHDLGILRLHIPMKRLLHISWEQCNDQTQN